MALRDMSPKREEGGCSATSTSRGRMGWVTHLGHGVGDVRALAEDVHLKHVLAPRHEVEHRPDVLVLAQQALLRLGAHLLRAPPRRPSPPYCELPHWNLQSRAPI